MEELLNEKPDAMLLLNKTLESGEKLFSSTAPEGREGIRLQVQDLQNSMDALFDKMSKLERDLQNKLVKWTGYEDSSASFFQMVARSTGPTEGKHSA